MEIKEFSDRAVDTLTQQPILKDVIRKGDDQTNRAVLTAYHAGCQDGSSEPVAAGSDRGSSPSTTNRVPDVKSFIDRTLPELRKRAA
jgi:hypothetical protein